MKNQGYQLVVLGCGTMGHTIALQAALCGKSVCLVGVTDGELRAAEQEIKFKLKTLVDFGMLENDGVVESRISTSTDIDAVAPAAAFLIEAVPEMLDLKIDIFRKLDKLCSSDVILASNTSGLLPSQICSGMQHPQRFIITHFWNPAHLVPLVEVVPCNSTSTTVIEETFQFLEGMGKKPVLVKKEIPGFIGNRLQFALFREAQYLLEEGVASKEDIDAAVRYGIGRRLSETGPLESADLGGLDVFSAISTYLDLCNEKGPLPTLKKHVAEKNYGEKTGKGFYVWDTSRKEAINRQREKTLIEFLKKDKQKKAL